MKRKKSLFLIGVLIFTLALVACGDKKDIAEKPETEKLSDTHIVVDMNGREVELKKDIETIAVTPIPWASLVYAIDGNADRLVAMNPSAMKSYEISFLKNLSPEFAKADTEIISKDFKINMEEMANLDPDVVIVWDYQTEEIEQLGKLGIPAVAIKYGSLESLQEGMTLLGSVLNKEEKAKELVNYHQDTASYFEEKLKETDELVGPEVVYLRDKDLTIFGKKSVNQIFFDLTGGKNLAEEVEDKTSINMEQIIDWDPEMIYLSNFDDFLPEDLYNNSFDGQDWSNLKAVKNKKVYKTPIGIYRWDAPCAESPLMMMWMAKVQQPEIFKDLNLEEEIKDFYKKFYDFELSQTDLNKILNTEVNEGLEIQ